MRLTNKQLEVVINNIESKITNKIKEDTEGFNKFLKDSSYSNMEKLVLEREKLQVKIDKLKEQQEELKAQQEELDTKGKNITKSNSRWYSLPGDKEELLQTYKGNFFNEKRKNFPTRSEIESDIILMSLSKEENPIEQLLTKYSL